MVPAKTASKHPGHFLWDEPYVATDGIRSIVQQHGQVVLGATSEVYIDRLVSETRELLTGGDLFVDKATLDFQTGGNSGWVISTSANGVLLPLTFLDRIYDASVSKGRVAFRATDVAGNESIYLAEEQSSLQRLVASFSDLNANGVLDPGEAGQLLPDGAGIVSAIGSRTNRLMSPAVALDGDRVVFVAQSDMGRNIGLFALIDGSLKTIVSHVSDFGGKTLNDLSIGHQAISGNEIVFKASFTDGTESIYQATLPAEPFTTVDVPAGGLVSGFDFGASAEPGTIRGVSFTDTIIDGELNRGESGNAGRTVFLDENLNGVPDDGEHSAVTGEDGRFVFFDLPAEQSYVIREVLPEGVGTTTQRSIEDSTVFVSAASTVEINLGSIDLAGLGESADGSVSGVVFNDANGNGLRDDVGSEPGIWGVTVFVDENADGLLNGGERSTVTASDGSYTISQLTGVKQAVRIVTNPGTSSQTSPLGNAFTTSTLRTIDSPVEVVTGDFNGDGIDDLATTINQSSEVRFFINDGTGAFNPGARVEVAGGPGSIAVGHFAGSGSGVGLVVGHRTTSSVKVLQPQQDGSIEVIDLVTPQDVQAGGSLEGMGDAPYFVTTGDFNGDGRDDIAVTSQNALPNGGTVSTFLSQGDGTFLLEQTVPLPRASADFPDAITAGLVDANGTVDLVVANLLTRNVTILKNTGVAGSGRFEIDQSLSIGGIAPSSVQLGDLDGDGDNEIVTTNLLSNDVSILVNNGDGTFEPVVRLAAGFGPAYARLVDLDLDGHLDIAFTNSETGNRFGVLRNRGDGTFLAAETSGLAVLQDGTLAFSLAIGRFDDDNQDGVIDELDTPDVVVSNRSDETLNGVAGSLTVGLNTIVAGALRVELPVSTRSATGLDFGVQTLNQLPAMNAVTSPALIDEDAGEQTVVITGVTTGGESETLSVMVSSSNTALINPSFVYDDVAGTITTRYTPGANLSGSAVVTVTVRDTGANRVANDADDGFASVQFTVTVEAVNDAPVMDAPSHLTIDEDADMQTVSLVGISAGGGETQPLRLTVLSSNQSVIPIPTLTYASPNPTATLTFTPVPDASGTSTIMVLIEDGGPDGILGTDSDNGVSTLYSFNVTVTAQNDAPMVTAVSDLTLTEDAPTRGVVISGISAGGGENQPLRVTAVSSNPAVVEAPIVDYVSPRNFAVVSVSPVADRSGQSTITVTVEDGGLDGDLDTAGDNGSTVRTFEVSVSAVNDAPTLDGLGGFGIGEGAAAFSVGLSGISAGGGESQSLRVSAVSSDPDGVPHPVVEYVPGAADGVLTIAPVRDAFGSFTISVTVEDAGSDGDFDLADDNASVTRTLRLTIRPENDAPTLDVIDGVSVLSDGGFVDVSLSGISAGPLEDQTLRVSASSSLSSVLPAPAVTFVPGESSANLRLVPVTGQNGVVTVTVTVEDAGLDGDLDTAADNAVTSRSFEVTVTAPQPATQIGFDEDGVLVIADPAASDAADGNADNLTLSIDGDELVITDPDNELASGIGTQISDHEVRVLLSSLSDGRVSVRTGPGNDSVDATSLPDGTIVLTVDGGAGDDVLMTGAGPDLIFGGDGHDTISGGLGDDTIHGGAGHDSLRGESGNDVIRGGDGNDSLYGGAQLDDLQGEAGNDEVYGQGSTGDSVGGGPGDDTIDGGSGNDVLVDGGDADITVTNGAMIGGLGNDVLVDVERALITGGAGANRIDLSGFLVPGFTTSTVFGGDGNDTIIGSGANEQFRGDQGDDSLIGNGGNDYLAGGAGADTLTGGDGDDRLRGLGGSGDRLTGGPGKNDLNGGDGNDLLIELITGSVRLDRDNRLEADVRSIFREVQTVLLFGSDLDDVIDASGFTREGVLLRVFGGDGNDTLIGSRFGDSLDGGAGNDILQGRGGRDTLLGGAGSDGLSGGSEDDLLSGSDGDDTLFGGLGNDTVFGDVGRDVLFGNDGDDALNGATSSGGDDGDTDTLVGGSGDGTDQTGDSYSLESEVDLFFTLNPLPDWADVAGL
jgi:hypothetical protein